MHAGNHASSNGRLLKRVGWKMTRLVTFHPFSEFNPPAFSRKPRPCADPDPWPEPRWRLPRAGCPRPVRCPGA
jgi:hypothetical protein